MPYAISTTLAERRTVPRVMNMRLGQEAIAASATAKPCGSGARNIESATVKLTARVTTAARANNLGYCPGGAPARGLACPLVGVVISKKISRMSLTRSQPLKYTFCGSGESKSVFSHFWTVVMEMSDQEQTEWT